MVWTGFTFKLRHFEFVLFFQNLLKKEWSLCNIVLTRNLEKVNFFAHFSQKTQHFEKTQYRAVQNGDQINQISLPRLTAASKLNKINDFRKWYRSFRSFWTESRIVTESFWSFWTLLNSVILDLVMNYHESDCFSLCRFFVKHSFFTAFSLLKNALFVVNWKVLFFEALCSSIIEGARQQK